MRYLLIALFLIISLNISFSQNSITNDMLVDLKEEKIIHYKPKVTSGQLLFLNMDYGSSIITNPIDAEQLKGAAIASVDIVYSDFPIDAKFPNLTNNRIEKVKKLIAGFLKNKIEWRLIRQQDCHDLHSAKELFHGVVISYRPTQSKEGMAGELAYLRKLFPEPHSIKVESLTYTSALELSTEYKTDSVFKRGKFLSRREYVPGKEAFKDSTVLSVLSRNNWRDMTIVADLTGSMSPYTAQLLIWIRSGLNSQEVKELVFFNDGDLIPDNKKAIGKTGGIYSCSSIKFDDVRKMAFTTMKNGNGGDIPENNIEALIKAIEQSPDAENIIMIADNWASIKDISLASKIKKPIKIVLCGADCGINAEYLNLARKTGGSVHTMDEDFTELMKKKEGQEIIINGQRFKVEGDMLIKVLR